MWRALSRVQGEKPAEDFFTRLLPNSRPKLQEGANFLTTISFSADYDAKPKPVPPIEEVAGRRIITTGPGKYYRRRMPENHRGMTRVRNNHHRRMSPRMTRPVIRGPVRAPVPWISAPADTRPSPSVLPICVPVPVPIAISVSVAAGSAAIRYQHECAGFSRSKGPLTSFNSLCSQQEYDQRSQDSEFTCHVSALPSQEGFSLRRPPNLRT
jgi:hypothetical protein